LLENQSGVKKKIEKEVFGADIPHHLDPRQDTGQGLHCGVRLQSLPIRVE
jgi:hypothetical protein